MGNHAERSDSPRSCRDALSKKCYRIHKTGRNKKRRHKTRTRDLWNTRRETQIQTKLDQPPQTNGQHQTAEIRPHLQTPGKERMAEAPGNDGNASIPEQVKRPNTWSKMMMMMMILFSITQT